MLLRRVAHKQCITIRLLLSVIVVPNLTNCAGLCQTICWENHGKSFKQSDITLDVCTEKGIQMQKVEGL